jgi:transposase
MEQEGVCRQFANEFKREAVGLLASSGRPLTQIARELGITHSSPRPRETWGRMPAAAVDDDASGLQSSAQRTI